MIMPGRKFSSATQYRYGFNGKEEDDDVSGDGNQYDYGFRIHNPRLGRFLSVDPLFQSYPCYTPNQFAENKLIWQMI
jgi:RHS repeat-associated protein